MHFNAQAPKVSEREKDFKIKLKKKKKERSWHGLQVLYSKAPLDTELHIRTKLGIG